MKTITVILIFVVIFAGTSGLVTARQSAKRLKAMSPRAVVVDLYKQHKKRSPFFQRRSRALLDQFFTRELATLIWNDARSSGGEVGALDGDPLFNAQEMQITNFTIGEGTRGAQAAEVLVSFENLSEKHHITFHLVKNRGSWRIADLVYDDGTTLSGIFKTDATLAPKSPRD